MNLDLAYFELPFHKPYRIGSDLLPSRRGVMLRVKRGRSFGYGEVAPLPGFHQETLANAVDSLREAVANDATPMWPSAAFGLSCAVETAARNPRFGFADPITVTDIGVNAFFSGGVRDAKAAHAKGLFNGFNTIKIKIGRGKPVDDLRTINTILDLVGPDVRLRLDGNRLLSLQSAERLLRRLDAARIEYVEEALRDDKDLSELARRVGMVMAIDEGVHLGLKTEEMGGAPGVDVQVVKPSLIGALEEVEAVVTQGKINGMETVLSTAVDSSYTIALVARMASALGASERDHGLGTATLLAADTIAPTPVINGRMAVSPTLPVPKMHFVPLADFQLPPT
jgi:O-succinylbenzoate synthase